MAQSDRFQMAAIEHAADLIAQADAVVVAAGAGIGVDSGLPDFRGTEGFWRAYPALGRAGLRFEAVASPEAFERDPRIAWGFYGHRLSLYRRTVPHQGFHILRRWMAQATRPGLVFTSNVDGQFQRAGFDGTSIHECHGSIHHLQCTQCDAPSWSAEALEPVIDEAECRWVGELPSCPACGSLARPNVLMFGDGDWDSRRAEVQAQRIERLLASVERPVCIEVGAGTTIPSVRWFSHRVVTDRGGLVVRINLRESATAASFGVGLPLGALEALCAIEAVLSGR